MMPPCMEAKACSTTCITNLLIDAHRASDVEEQSLTPPSTLYYIGCNQTHEAILSNVEGLC